MFNSNHTAHSPPNLFAAESQGGKAANRIDNL